MKLGVSELAWERLPIAATLELLSERNIKYIETVIPKHVDWMNVDLTQLRQHIATWKKYGIEVKSTQSITYNANITAFTDFKFIDHIHKVSDICAQLNIDTMVLGAPTLRIKRNSTMLIDDFRKIDLMLKERNQILLIEPNSRIYNGQYFFTVNEIISFIRICDFTNIKTMIDTHNIILEGQQPADIFNKYQSYIHHVHVSENGLSSFKNAQHHADLAEALHEANYQGLVVYECMKTPTLIGDIELFSYIYNK